MLRHLGREHASHSGMFIGGVAGALVALALTAALLAGCGGGGGGGTPGAAGRVTGTVSTQNAALGATAAASTGANFQNMRVAIDGTNITAPVSADGSFALPSIPPGQYMVSVVSADGSVAGHAGVVVSSGATTTTAVDLLPAGRVAGTVSTQSATGVQPVAGAQVTLTAASAGLSPIPIYSSGPMPMLAHGSAAGSSRQASPPTPTGSTPLTLTTTSDSAGNYDIPGVPAGLYQVSAANNGITALQFVSVSPAQTSVANLSLTGTDVSGTATVHGTVVGVAADGTSAPVAGASVMYAMCGPAVYNGGTSSGSAVSGTVTSGSTPSAGMMRGRGMSRSRQATTDPGHVILPCLGAVGPMAPTMGASASSSSTTGIAQPAPGIMPMGATTDAQGNYTLQVPVAAVDLVASANGYGSQSQALSLTANGNVQVDFQLTSTAPDPKLVAAMTLDGPSTVTSGTKVGVHLTLTNTASHAVEVKMFGPGDVVTVDDSNGQFVWSSVFGLMLPDIATIQTLQPGASITDSETWPGAYADGALVPSGSYTFQGVIAGLNTNPVTVTVTGGPAPQPAGSSSGGGIGNSGGGAIVPMPAQMVPTT